MHVYLYLYLCLLPRCMECRCGLAMRILSVHLSVKRVIYDKTKQSAPAYLYHMKDHLQWFCDNKNG